MDTQNKPLLGGLFLATVCLAILVKLSRVGGEGVVIHAGIWHALPNYCFVFGLGLLGLLVKPHFEEKAYFKYSASIVFGTLLYEVEQLWMDNRSFDLFDMVATVLGGLSAWYVYKKNFSQEEISGDSI